MNAFWKWIKKIGLFLGAILICLQLFDWGAKFSRHGLVARLECGGFELPPQLDDFYSDLIKQLDADAVVPRVLQDERFKYVASNIKGLSDSQRENLVRAIVRLLPNEPAIEIPRAFTGIESYWKGTITNSSLEQITAAQLYLDGARFALVRRDDNSQTALSVENVVNIGDLRAREQVQVSIWSRYGLDYYRYAPDVRLTHRFGVGKVTIPRLVTGFPAFLDKYDFVFYSLLVWFFLVVVVTAILAMLQSREGKKTSGDSEPLAEAPLVNNLHLRGKRPTGLGL
jgi:hypothetical protein